MSYTVWRIGTDTPDYTAEDMAGIGAKTTGGRWNQIGIAVTYAATSRALAAMETLVHLNAGGLPLNRYLVDIEIPDAVWSAAQIATAAGVGVGWDAEPAGRVSIAYGTAWVASNRSALLVVPSVIVPEEQNVIINPAHADAAKITARKVRKWVYDPRLKR